MRQPKLLRQYLSHGYYSIEGMSSKIAAKVASSLLIHQTACGIRGPSAEIGVFRGRFAIALALALEESERFVAIDLFAEPKMIATFRSNLKRWNVPVEQVDIWTADTSMLPDGVLRERLGGSVARLIHIDGNHTPKALAHDLALAALALGPGGILILDDMHHPYYPLLMVSVFDFLAAHPEYRLLAIIDRASLVEATKYVLCERDRVDSYSDHILSSFPTHAQRDLVDFVDYKAIVITATLWGNRFAAARNAGFRLSYFRDRALARLRRMAL